MPIIKLQPFCKTALWGGSELKHRFGKQFHHQKLAETWELSCHPNGESIIANGPFARTNTAHLFDAVRQKFVGRKLQGYA